MDPIFEIADLIETNLWRYVADQPPEPVMMSGTCQLAAQLLASRIYTIKFGCSVQHANAYVVEADHLAVEIERLGGPERIAGSLVAGAAIEAANFSRALLDLMAQSAA